MAFHTTSSLAVLLLECFAKGELPGTRVAEIAAAAWKDGWCHNDPLAKDLANAGQSKANALRDVIRAARRAGFLSKSSQPYVFTVPGPDGVQMTQEIFLPHEIYFDQVQKTKGAKPTWTLSPDVIAMNTGLGQTLRDWAADPDVNYHGDLGEVGILGLHCDGASYTTTNRAGGSKSVVVGSVNIVSAPDPHLRGRRHLVFVVSKRKLCDCGCSGWHTFQSIFDVFSWSMRHLVRGEWPSCRHDGSPWNQHDIQNRTVPEEALPVAALLQLRGDWEWMVVCYRFRFYTSVLFCWMCNATLAAGPCCFKDVRREAGHRATLISHSAYVEECARHGDQPSTIFRSPGTKLQHNTVDGMHAGDLGPFQDAMGSLFWIHITDKRRYKNKAAGLVSLNKMIGMYYTANRDKRLTRITPLTQAQIRSDSPGYPVLKSSAAGCRHLGDFCLALAYQHLHGGDGHGPFRFRATHRLAGTEAAHNALVVQVFEGLTAYQRACTEKPFNPQTCKDGMYTFLDGFMRLSEHWRNGAAEDACAHLPWHPRQKLHLLQHLVEDKIVLFGSPADFWCYGDEDFVGVIKKAEASTGC